MSDEEEMLVDREEYLSHGVHIGTKAQNKSMEKYIFHVKKNQLAILNLDQTDERIRDAAKFLSRYDPENILVVGRKEESVRPIEKFAETTGADTFTGRFMPGTLTNPQSENFREPEVVLVADPEEDGQAVTEAVSAKIPVVGIADSENSTENLDLVIPANNKGANSLSMVFYLLASQMKEQADEEANFELEEFKTEEQREEEEDEE
ncbi:MAG: 30S ribosomal protein S2 [Candidatus Nanohaloarchaea archaeon]